MTERSQPNGVKTKMRERKLRSGVNRQQGMLKLNGVKQVWAYSTPCKTQVFYDVRCIAW